MTGELVEAKSGGLESVRAGGAAEKRFLEFFAAQIRNRNTREAYLRAVRGFLDWAQAEAGLQELLDIEPMHVGGLGGAQDPVL